MQATRSTETTAIVPLNPRSPAQIEDAMGQLHAIENATRRRRLHLAFIYDARSLWTDDGARCMEDWLRAKYAMSWSAARDFLRVAHALEELPEIAAAFEAGVLSWDQLLPLTEIATPKTDAEFAHTAPRFTVAQLAALARRRREITAQEVNEAHRRRCLELSWSLDRTTLRISGRLPTDLGAVVEKAIRRRAAAQPKGPDGLYRPAEQTAADALVELASAAIAADADADRATVVVHTESIVLAGDGTAELEGRHPLAAETLRRLACDCRVTFVNHDQLGHPLGVGHTTRKVPRWLDREVRYRDGGCRFPGCGRECFTHNHHIDHWIKGGPTQLPNLVQLCRFHHRLFHEGGWSMRGDPDTDLILVRPDGTILRTGPPPMHWTVRQRLFCPADP
ncbi:MAG: DUF222 domain-containing protein [Actinomycetota bacterium]